MSLEICQQNNTVVGSTNLCTQEVEFSSYGFNVHDWIAGAFCAAYGVALTLHLVQALLSRQWFMLATVCACCTTELIGWGGRLWSALSTEWHEEFGGYWYSNDDAFLMQISTLIIAPAMLAAAYYILLGKIIKAFGPQYCRFDTRTYSIVFVCGDVLGLVIQAAGGAMASMADDKEGSDRGAMIMVIGVFVQMTVMTLFSLVLVDFVWHFLKCSPVKPLRLRKKDAAAGAYVASEDIIPSALHKAKILVAAICTSTALVFLRSIYRCVELLGGWHGPIAENELLFNLLDGLLVLIAVLLFNAFHPLVYWPKEDELAYGLPRTRSNRRSQSSSRDSQAMELPAMHYQSQGANIVSSSRPDSMEKLPVSA